MASYTSNTSSPLSTSSPAFATPTGSPPPLNLEQQQQTPSSQVPASSGTYIMSDVEQRYFLGESSGMSFPIRTNFAASASVSRLFSARPPPSTSRPSRPAIPTSSPDTFSYVASPTSDSRRVRFAELGSAGEPVYEDRPASQNLGPPPQIPTSTDFDPFVTIRPPLRSAPPKLRDGGEFHKVRAQGNEFKNGWCALHLFPSLEKEAFKYLPKWASGRLIKDVFDLLQPTEAVGLRLEYGGNWGAGVDGVIRGHITKKGGTMRGSVLLSLLVDGYQYGGDTEAPASQAPVKAVWVSNPTPIAALGGVRQVPTSLPATQISPGYERPWSFDLWPNQVVPQVANWRHGHNVNTIALTRPSSFVYHFPENLNRGNLSEDFTVQLELPWFRRLDIDAENTVETQYSRGFTRELVDRTIREEFTEIAQVLDNNLSLDVLKAADSKLDFSRAMGTRGHRAVGGWESNIMARWLRNRDFATSSRANRNYREFTFRIMSRYLLSLVSEGLLHDIPGYERHVDNTATNVQIIHINAETVPGIVGPPQIPAIWGEEQLWQPAALDGLLQGRRQFLDVEGYSREDIAQLIGCLAPSTEDHLAYLRTVAPQAGHQRPSPEGSLLANVARHTFPNGTTHIYLHHGNDPLPGLADQAWIQAHAFDFPSYTNLGTSIRALTQRHGLGDSFIEALDAVLYRSVGFSAQQMLGVEFRKITGDVIDANGHYALYLPRNNTAASYFDVFFVPSPAPIELGNFLAMTYHEVVHNATLACFCRATSMAWAAKSATEVGVTWTVPAVGGNPRVRNHHSKWQKQYYSDLNLWSVLHANTQGLQYGFAPTYNTRRTEVGVVIDWWHDYLPPTMTNHYLELWAMQVIPTFQLLPYYDPIQLTSHVQWAPDTPDQTASLDMFSQDVKVRLAREFEPFPNYSWLGDGGQEYNAQFYMAQGNNGQFAYEGGRPKAAFSWWSGDYARNFPAAPVGGVRHSFAPVGSHFGDFLLPGSLLCFNIPTNRIRNWGVGDSAGNRLVPQEAYRWWMASKGAANISLMVNYVSPFDQHIEIDSLVDYSVALWDRNTHFAGLTFTPLTTALNKGTFDPINSVSQQTPFSFSFDSRPRSFLQNDPSRVTQRTPLKGPTVAEEGVEKRMDAEGINTNLRVAAQVGRLTYENKYPKVQDEVPPMDEHTVAITRDEGIVPLPDGYPPERAQDDYIQRSQEALAQFTAPEPANTAVLARLNQIQDALDREFNSYLESEQVRRARDAVTERVRAPHPRNNSWVSRQPRRRTHPATVGQGSVKTSFGGTFASQTPVFIPQQPQSVARAQNSFRGVGVPPPAPAPPAGPRSGIVPNDQASAGPQQFAMDRAQLMSRMQAMGIHPSSPRPYRGPSPIRHNTGRVVPNNLKPVATQSLNHPPSQDTLFMRGALPAPESSQLDPQPAQVEPQTAPEAVPDEGRDRIAVTLPPGGVRFDLPPGQKATPQASADAYFQHLSDMAVDMHQGVATPKN